MENKIQPKMLSELEVKSLNFSKDFLKITLDFSDELGLEPISTVKILTLIQSKRKNEIENITQKLLSNVVILLTNLKRKDDNLLLRTKFDVYLDLGCNCPYSGMTACVCIPELGTCTCTCGTC